MTSRKTDFHFLVNQIADPVEIEKMVDKVLADNPKQLEQYRGGKTKLQGYFAGQVQFSYNLRDFFYYLGLDIVFISICSGGFFFNPFYIFLTITR